VNTAGGAIGASTHAIADAMSATTATAEWQQRWQSSIMDTYGTPPLVLVSGSGARVTDADGRTYLDLVAGIAVNALGHAHPAVVEAVSRQVATLGHTSNLVVNTVAVQLAERLLGIFCRDGRVFFCNSGAEANEAAFKLSRLTGRTRLVAASGSFHGRTMGALALTGQPAKQQPFVPLPGDVVFVPYGDVDALRAAVDDATAAVVLEPVQGEGGVIPPPPGYLVAAEAIARGAGALFVLDEVQTGIGRAGAWFAHQPDGLTPDVVTLAKGLGGGLPLGACIGFGAAAELLRPGQHGSTFGGNPVSCAAALAVLDTIESEGLLVNADRMGAAIREGVRGLAHPLTDQVRGRGLLLAITLREPLAAALESALRERGILVNAVAPDAIRLAPPLIIGPADVAELIAELGPALDNVAGAA
jgi:acetylornithine/N-succinyldiaminopimelate aminotransferase